MFVSFSAVKYSAMLAPNKTPLGADRRRSAQDDRRPVTIRAANMTQPAPFASPPFPTAEYQGFPLIGVPPSDTVYPLMGAIYGGPWGEEIKESRVKLYGWVNASGNWSTGISVD